MKVYEVAKIKIINLRKKDYEIEELKITTFSAYSRKVGVFQEQLIQPNI